MSEAGWERRLEDLARAQECAAELREGMWETVAAVRDGAPRRCDDADSYDVVDALIDGPLAPLMEAKAAVRRVRAIANDIDPVVALTVHARADREIADRLRRAIDVNMPVQPLYGPWGDEQARTGVRGSGQCGATEGDERG